MIDYSRIGARIREARKRQGMTQAELADQIEGVSRTMIAKYELGRIHNPPIRILDLIADACDVSLNWLLEDDENG